MSKTSDSIVSRLKNEFTITALLLFITMWDPDTLEMAKEEKKKAPKWKHKNKMKNE